MMYINLFVGNLHGKEPNEIYAKKVYTANLRVLIIDIEVSISMVLMQNGFVRGSCFYLIVALLPHLTISIDR